MEKRGPWNDMLFRYSVIACVGLNFAGSLSRFPYQKWFVFGTIILALIAFCRMVHLYRIHRRELDDRRRQRRVRHA